MKIAALGGPEGSWRRLGSHCVPKTAESSKKEASLEPRFEKDDSDTFVVVVESYSSLRKIIDDVVVSLQLHPVGSGSKHRGLQRQLARRSVTRHES